MPIARRIPVIACLTLLFGGCDRADQEPIPVTQTVDSATAAALQTVAGMRIVFAHQSVGGEVLQGVQSLAAQARVSLPVEESRAPPAAGIHHYKVGQNEAPDLKLSDFIKTTDGAGASGVDVALFKLCYIDFDQQTDSGKLADAYIAALDSLQRRNPATKYVAVTTPVTVIQEGPKALIKKLMGKTPGGFALNAKRQEFNERLRAHFTDGNLFDLARIESAPQGTARKLEFEGRPIDALDARITYDGTHLNESGQRIVATQLVQFLAKQQK